MAACRCGDVLVVTRLDRLARSLPDARDIVAELTTREVKLSLGGSVHDPTDPVGRLPFNVLAACVAAYAMGGCARVVIEDPSVGSSGPSVFRAHQNDQKMITPR